MRHLLFLIIAGLFCLAIIITTGCGNEGPIAPPINAGSVTVTDDGDGQFIANEPVVIAWDFVPRIDNFRVDYSIDGKIWHNAGETKLTHLDWKIPGEAGIAGFKIRVDGYASKMPSPRSRAVSQNYNVLPFGEATDLEVLASPTIQQDIVMQIELTAKDKFGNTVTPYQSSFINIWGELLRGNGSSENMNIVSFDGFQTLTTISGEYAFMYTGVVWVDGTKKIETCFHSTNLPYKDGKIIYRIDSDTLNGYAESVITE